MKTVRRASVVLALTGVLVGASFGPRPEDPVVAAARQGELLRRFATHVRPGGRLVYATCSLARTENEGVVGAFLESEPRFAVRLSVATLLPSQLDSDGFFVAVMQRK